MCILGGGVRRPRPVFVPSKRPFRRNGGFRIFLQKQIPNSTSNPVMNPRRIPSVSLLSALLLVFAGPLLLAEAPPNDNYFVPAELGDAPATATGTTVESTIQKWESDVGAPGKGTVWYRWTAPQAGWYAIHTAATTPGTALDTVISLYTDGANLFDSEFLGFNDTSARPGDAAPGIYGPGQAPSRLVFEAEAATSYRVAVAGKLAGGNFEIHVVPVLPSLVVGVLGFGPAVADVTSGSDGLTAYLKLTSSFAFSGGQFELMRPGETSGFMTLPFSVGQRDTGDDFAGDYSIPFVLGMFQARGEWGSRLTFPFHAENEPGSWTPRGGDLIEDDHLITHYGAPPLVVNKGTVDSAPPTPGLLTATPPQLDATESAGLLNFQLPFTDAHSGMDRATVFLKSGATIQQIGDLGPSDFQSGDPNSGSFNAPLLVPSDLPLGSYQVVAVLRDAVGNEATYGGSGGLEWPGGSSSTIELVENPPMNDMFGTATVVGPSLPVNIRSDNRNATTEPGEPAFGGSANTIWYSWTAPSSDWVSISLAGAGGSQPVMGLFTGTSLANLVELGRNYGSVPPLALVFQTQGGTTYRIAVTGRSATPTGDFLLDIQSIPQPSVRLTALTFSPAAVNVGTSAQNVTVGLTFESDQSLFIGTQIEVTLAPENHVSGAPQLKFVLNSGNRTSGNDFAGTYSRAVSIPAYLPAATWVPRVRIFMSGGTVHTWTPTGSDLVADHFLLAVSGARLPVANTGQVDNLPPTLVAVSGLPSAVDPSTGNVPVTLQLQVDDDLAGMSTGTVSLTQQIEGGSTTHVQLSPFGNAQRISGNAASSVYEIFFELDGSLANGLYDLEIRLNDPLGRTITYGTSGSPFPAGATKQISIGPLLSGYSAWLNTQDFGPGQETGMGDDPNNDGVPNLLCYAFNLPPNGPTALPMTPGSGDLSGLPAISVVGSGASLRLRVEYLRRITLQNGLVYLPEFSGNLLDSGEDGWRIHTGPSVVAPVSADWERVVIEDVLMGASRRFGRIDVISSP